MLFLMFSAAIVVLNVDMSVDPLAWDSVVELLNRITKTIGYRISENVVYSEKYRINSNKYGLSI